MLQKGENVHVHVSAFRDVATATWDRAHLSSPATCSCSEIIHADMSALLRK
jgi:hypothetical protein